MPFLSLHAHIQICTVRLWAAQSLATHTHLCACIQMWSTHALFTHRAFPLSPATHTSFKHLLLYVTDGVCVYFPVFFPSFPLSSKREKDQHRIRGIKYSHHIPPPAKMHVGYLRVCVRLWSLPPSLLPPHIKYGMRIQCIFVCMYWYRHIYSVCMHMSMESKHVYMGASHPNSHPNVPISTSTSNLFRYLFTCIFFHFLSLSPSPSSLSQINIKIAKLHTYYTACKWPFYIKTRQK